MLWLGIDSGQSQLGLAVLSDSGEVLTQDQVVATPLPEEQQGRASSRLAGLLPVLDPFRDQERSSPARPALQRWAC